MSDSVGQIGLDLVVNQNQFNRQMQGIQGIAKKAGVALAAAFAVKKLISFGASCVELGSDLQEVQNVVDVTFPSMAKKVNEFAQSAAASFGLSETMAKKFTGTFGAMAKAFGFSESAAYEMSTTLTGLAGDVASFYNLSQDEAYTKLKSVFTGETESLKDLGVVMTQTALDAYALANGYGKTTAKMSEAEKVALRYKFVQQQLTTASGDFIRTSDSWANQVKILKLQFDSFKASIGQGLINVLTPVIKTINMLMLKLVSLGGMFKSFTESFMGKKSEDSFADSMAGAEDVAGNISGSMDSANSSAQKMKKTLAGFDELNVLSSTGGGAGSSGTGAAPDTSAGDSSSDPNDESDQTEGVLDRIKKQVKELIQQFKAGFQSGLGIGFEDSLDRIKTNVRDIGRSLKEIFTDSQVLNAANSFSESIARNMGKGLGAIVSIGASIVENLTGGISQYFANNSNRVKDYLVEMFNIGSRGAEIGGNVAVVISTIAESLRSDSAKRITEALTGIFANGFMGITELVGKFGVDILDTITAPFVENSGLIKDSLEKTFTALAPILEELKDLVDEAFTKIQATYDDYVHPVIMDIKNGLTELGSKALKLYNTYIVPALDGISQKFSEFKDQYLSPLIDKFNEFAAKASEAVSVIWNEWLKPFVDWFMEMAFPALKKVIDLISDVFFELASGIATVVGDILNALGGLMDFITGTLTGDWELAWTGVKDFCIGIWNALRDTVSGILNAIWEVIQYGLKNIKDFFSNIWTAIKEKLSGILDSMLNKIDKIFPGMRDIIITACKAMKDQISNIWNSIKNFFSNTLNNISGVLRNSLTGIKLFWNQIWNDMKNSVVNIFNGIWSSIKGVINSILGGVESMANGIVRGLNRAIEALNRISFDIPDWVPEIGGMKFGINIPTLPELSIPKLAQGGYVKANTPQLAMIGDNRHQGEVVAPENKLQEMAAGAVRTALQASENATAEKLERIISIMLQLVELVAAGKTIEMDGRQLGKTLQRLNMEYYKATGSPLFST